MRTAGTSGNMSAAGVVLLLHMQTPRDFPIYLPFNYNVGDRGVFNLLRDDKLEFPRTLPVKPAD